MRRAGMDFRADAKTISVLAAVELGGESGAVVSGKCLADHDRKRVDKKM